MNRTVLVIGDSVAILIVTAIGFATHGDVAASSAVRFIETALPLLAAWFLLASSLGLFDPPVSEQLSELWRPAFVMLFAGPAATIVRGILLGAPVIPSFAVVISLTTALGLILWRAAYLLTRRRAA